MRTRAIVASAAVHVAALVLVVRASQRPRAAPIVPATRVDAPRVPPPATIDIELVPVAGLAAIAATRGTGAAEAPSMRPGDVAVAPRVEPAKPGHALAMRFGPAPLAIAPDVGRDIAPVAIAVTPALRDSAELVVARDGTARALAPPAFTIHRAVPTLHQLGDALEAWYADPYAPVRAGRERTLLRAAVDDATPDFIPLTTHEWQLVLPVAAGTFDATSIAMRALHAGDPDASRKLALLDRTRDARAARGAEDRRDRLARSAEYAVSRLDALAASGLTGHELRVALFELWDECDEGDNEAGAAGDRARAMVLGWIRGHHVAYTAGELSALAARRTSAQPFAP
ncbi:MAG TPA: hypothetical protein VGG74_21900 [Kofleriaceae bacterium]|jgi:hypothetical protein